MVRYDLVGVAKVQREKASMDDAYQGDSGMTSNGLLRLEILALFGLGMASILGNLVELIRVGKSESGFIAIATGCITAIAALATERQKTRTRPHDNKKEE